MISKRALRVYLRYKAHSGYLFTNPTWKTLDDLVKWPDNEVERYKKQLMEGYIANLRCATARREYRDRYIPILDRDEGHEKAIQEAERLKDDFGFHLSALQKAVLALRRTDPPLEAVSLDNVDEEVAKVVTSTHKPEQEAVPDVWVEIAERLAFEESEAEKLANCIDQALSEIVDKLRLSEHEAGIVMLGCVRRLAPTTECEWSLSNPQTVRALHTILVNGLPSEKELLSMAILEAVKYRKVDAALVSKAVDLEAVAAPLISKYNAIGIDGLQVAKRAILLKTIRDLKESSCRGGKNTIQVNALVDTNRFADKLSEPHSLRSVLSLTKLPVDFFTNSDEVVAATFVSPQARGVMLDTCEKGVKAPSMSTCLRLFRSFMKKHWTGEKICSGRLDGLARACMLTFDGNLCPDVAIKHPALFLHKISADSVSSSARKIFKERILDEPVKDALHNVLQVVKDIVTCAEIMFDLQYFDQYERYIDTGVIGADLISNNPLEEIISLVGQFKNSRSAFSPAQANCKKHVIYVELRDRK